MGFKTKKMIANKQKEKMKTPITPELQQFQVKMGLDKLKW